MIKINENQAITILIIACLVLVAIYSLAYSAGEAKGFQSGQLLQAGLDTQAFINYQSNTSAMQSNQALLIYELELRLELERLRYG